MLPALDVVLPPVADVALLVFLGDPAAVCPVISWRAAVLSFPDGLQYPGFPLIFVETQGHLGITWGAYLAVRRLPPLPLIRRVWHVWLPLTLIAPACRHDQGRWKPSPHDTCHMLRATVPVRTSNIEIVHTGVKGRRQCVQRRLPPHPAHDARATKPKTGDRPVERSDQYVAHRPENREKP